MADCLVFNASLKCFWWMEQTQVEFLPSAEDWENAQLF